MEFFKKAVEDSPNPTYVKDQHGKIILANNAFAVVHGTTVKTILESGIAKQDFSLDLDMKLLKTGESSALDEYIKRKDGVKVWYNTVKKIIYNEDGESWLLSISSDITELKKANIIAAEAIKAKSTFLANVSHEIRTPMNGILGMARLLRKTNLSLDQEKYLQFILSNADTLLYILNEIIDYTNVESGEVIVDKISFDLVLEIEDVVDRARPKAEAKGLKLNFLLPTIPLPIVEGDSYLLKQVLNHLINNAIKFTQAGSIIVSLDVANNGKENIDVTFQVEDTGIGISTDKFDLVFESFNQAYTSSSRLYGGTGLGLTLSKKIIEIQGGKIWLESTPEVGTKFFFTIPYKLSKLDSSHFKSKKKITSPTIENLEVLLAEDNYVSQLLVTTYLNSKGAKVELANNGVEALEKVFNKKFDIILMDIQMPNLSGIETAKKIRQEPNKNQKTPIVAFTANVLRADLEVYTKSGFNDYLAKPFLENDLYRIVSLHTGLASLEQKYQANEANESEKDEGGVFNFSNLGSLAENKEFVQQMMELFVSSVPKEIAQLAEKIETEDWNAVIEISHGLKSTFGNIQVNEGYAALNKIENLAAKDRDLGEIFNQLKIVKKTASKTISVFNDKLKFN